MSSKPVANPSVVFTVVKSLPLQKTHPIRCCNILLQQFTKQICNRHVALMKATHIERDMTSYPSSVQKIMVFWCLFKCRNTMWVKNRSAQQQNVLNWQKSLLWVSVTRAGCVWAIWIIYSSSEVPSNHSKDKNSSRFLKRLNLTDAFLGILTL